MTQDEIERFIARVFKAADTFELAGEPPRIALRKALDSELAQMGGSSEAELDLLRRAVNAWSGPNSRVQ